MFPLMDLSQQFQNTLLTSDHEEKMWAHDGVCKKCAHIIFSNNQGSTVSM